MNTLSTVSERSGIRDRLYPIALSLTLVAAMPAIAQAQTTCASWTTLYPNQGSNAPPVREGSSVIYDTPHQRIIVFGGEVGTDGPLLNDVWSAPLSGPPVWSSLAPAGTLPPARVFHSAVFDPVRNRMIVFGGEGYVAGGNLADVWALSLTGTPTWTQLATSGGPPPPGQHAMVYDPIRDRLVVFGGYPWKTETWALSLTSNSWSLLTPSGSPPPGMNLTGVAYDSARDRMLIVGGLGAANIYDTVWSLSLAGGGSWSQLVTVGTSLPSGYSRGVIYDGSNDRLVVFGGYPLTNSVWELLLGGTPGWLEMSVDGAVPAPCYLSGIAFDTSNQRLIEFGGRGYDPHDTGPKPVYNDVAALSWGSGVVGIATGAAPLQSGSIAVSPAGACFTSGTTVTLTATPSTGYSFVGWTGDGSGSHNPLAVTLTGSKTVVANFATDLLHLSVSPVDEGDILKSPDQASYAPGSSVTLTAYPRAGYAFTNWSGDATGSASPVTVTFTGDRSVTANFDVHPPVCGGWSVILGTRPTPREVPGCAVDPVRHRILLFGGFGGVPDPNSSTFLNDLWAGSLASDAWSPLTAAGGPPSPRDETALIYDSVRDRMLLVGGNGASGPVNDLWQLSLTGTPTWTMLTANSAPTPRFAPTVVYDSVGDRLLMFSGYLGPNNLSNEVWELPLATLPLTWHKLTPSGTPPATRYEASAVYDPVGNRMIVFGGATLADINNKEAWQLALGGGTATWSQLASADITVGIRLGGVVYDPIRQRVIVACGNNAGGELLGRTSALLLKYTPIWTPVKPIDSDLTGRESMGAVYDPDNDRMVVIGGLDAVDANTRFIDQIYAFDMAGGRALDVGADPTMGSIDRSPGAACYQDGQSVTLTALPTAHHLFVAWHGDVTGTSNPTHVVIAGNESAWAEFTEVAVSSPEAAVDFALAPITPNPVHGEARIDFSLARRDRVLLTIHDLAGRTVARVVDGVREPGRYSVSWSRARERSGIYFVRLQSGGRTVVRTMALLQ